MVCSVPAVDPDRQPAADCHPRHAQDSGTSDGRQRSGGHPADDVPALSYDHRLIDGKEAVTFPVTMKDLLEDPARLLLDI